MFDLDKWHEIWITISRNKLRSLLTAFGVFWGILMLTLLLGVSNGLSNGMKSNIQGIATNSCFFFSDATSEPYAGFKKGRRWDISLSDVALIRSRVEGVSDVAPIVFGGRGTDNVMYGDKLGSFGVRGNGPELVRIEEQNMLYGRYINEIDINQKRKVCVIGKNVFTAFFNNGTNPCGLLIRCNGQYYRIIGVTKGVSNNISLGGRSDDMVVLPITTMQQLYNQGDVVHFFGVRAQDHYDISKLEQSIKDVLKIRHQISPTDPQAVASINIGEMFKTFMYLFLGISILTWIVGVGTLLAGAIGVSNIMLVSVRERTKEIGIRRALGAKPSNIISQIMTESLVLTAMAGFLGFSLGVGILALIDQIIANAPANGDIFLQQLMIDFKVGVSAAAILLFFGLLAGLLPAWRAMQIKPIEALGEE
ncbi:MAG TPA: ABC transporter permease [Bacteroidales bacterium]|nr:ABC transporter permease [Bacteroidales bacterium]